MKVFISWSGDLSKELAEAMRDWLPSVIQSIRPFFTPNDIEKGARWSKDISQQLEESQVGIFCLTKSNLLKPWIMFEAGALSKRIDVSRVCPILFDVENTDLEGPLVQFQTVRFTKDEIYKLICTLNKALKDSQLDDKVIENVFEKWWPDLNDKVNSILHKYQKSKHNDSESSPRSDREILEEILELSRLKSSRLVGSDTGGINPLAVEQLIASLDNIKNLLATLHLDSSEREFLESNFQDLEKPIGHIIRNTRRSLRPESSPISDLIKQLSHLTQPFDNLNLL